jgi:hypothetical protein
MSSASAVDWTERYEALRAHALGGGALGFAPLGLAVLRRRGVVGWMEVESRVQEPAASCHAGGLEGSAVEFEGAPARSELVRLLAATALLVATGGGP